MHGEEEEKDEGRKERGEEEEEGAGGQIWSPFHRLGLQVKGNGKQIYLPIRIAETKAKVI